MLLRIGTVVNFCKRDNETSNSTKDGKFLDQMNNYQPLKNKLAAWNWLIRYDKMDSPMYKCFILK
jgi:hypothetical protein